jgi:hypothetical protein
MKLLADLFALIGLVCTVAVFGFYIGYTTYHPPCSNPLAIFAKACK